MVIFKEEVVIDQATENFHIAQLLTFNRLQGRCISLGERDLIAYHRISWLQTFALNTVLGISKTTLKAFIFRQAFNVC